MAPALPFCIWDQMLDILSPNGFEFWVPLDLQKSQTKSKDGKRWIEGIASTESLDLQNEIVLQSGVDTTYFLKHGYFNNDHKPGFENKVGQPTECKVTKKGLWVKGYLFKNHKVADAIWELANSLEASSSDRKLGFSIQGKVLRRRGKTIVKCWIQDIAITAAPINTNTWLDVAKSLDALPPDIWCDESGCYVVTPDVANKAMKAAEGKCCGACNCAEGSRDQDKALSPEQMDLRKQDDDPNKEKALQAGGCVLVPESLEGNMKDQEWGRTDPKDDAKKSLVPDNQLSFEESVAHLQAYKNLSQPDAQLVARAVFHLNGLDN